MESSSASHGEAKLRSLGLAVLVILGIGIGFAFVVRLATRERHEPERCAPGLNALGARCCGQGQTLANGRCKGLPRGCAEGMTATGGKRPGCVGVDRRVAFAGGVLRLLPSDWEAEGRFETRQVRVRAFELDAIEVTSERWSKCVSAGGCRAVDESEPGRPVRFVTPVEALKFCRFFGGRLPTGDEWQFAAAGPSSRRFAWGQTGLVCRRAAFGLVEGPCAEGANGPEISGSRPLGATPEGLLDMSGNVAEWTLEPEPTPALANSQKGAQFVARGGSYLAKVAPELKSWSVEATTHAASHIGLRCAYDLH